MKSTINLYVVACTMALSAAFSYADPPVRNSDAELVLDFMTAADGTLDSPDDLLIVEASAGRAPAMQAGLHDSGAEPAEASATGVTSAPLAAGEPLARSIAGEPEEGLDEAEAHAVAAAGPGTCCIYDNFSDRFPCFARKCIRVGQSCPGAFSRCPLDRFYSVLDCATDCPASR